MPETSCIKPRPEQSRVCLFVAFFKYTQLQICVKTLYPVDPLTGSSSLDSGGMIKNHMNSHDREIAGCNDFLVISHVWGKNSIYFPTLEKT